MTLCIACGKIDVDELIDNRCVCHPCSIEILKRGYREDCIKCNKPLPKNLHIIPTHFECEADNVEWSGY